MSDIEKTEPPEVADTDGELYSTALDMSEGPGEAPAPECCKEGAAFVLPLLGAFKVAALDCQLPPDHEGPHSYQVEEDFRLSRAELERLLKEATEAGRQVENEQWSARYYQYRREAAAELRQYWDAKLCGAILQIPVLNAEGEPTAINVACCLLTEHDGDHSWQGLVTLFSGGEIPADAPPQISDSYGGETEGLPNV